MIKKHLHDFDVAGLRVVRVNLGLVVFSLGVKTVVSFLLSFAPAYIVYVGY